MTKSLASLDQAWGTESLAAIFRNVRGFIKRQVFVIAITLACTTATALLYLMVAKPMYTASAFVVIDTRKIQVLPSQAVLGDMSVDAVTGWTVLTEMEMLKSRSLSLSVIEKLHLAEHPEFLEWGGVSGLISSFLDLLKSRDGKLSYSEAMDRALHAFESRRAISRVGQTYMVQIDFQSIDPLKAARIADAIVAAYLEKQLESKDETARRAKAWLSDRANELQKDASEAEESVVKFKRDHNIVEGEKGILVSEQQVSELNSQLNIATAVTAEAKARLERIKEVMGQNIPSSSIADALKNEVIIHLRNQYLEYAARERTYEQKYGVNHLATINVRNQMQQALRNITDEMNKIAESYQSDYEIALSREESLRRRFQAVSEQSQETEQDRVALHNLESKAHSLINIYQNYLQRMTESAQQESFPIPDARPVNKAMVPLKQSNPKPIIVFVMSTISGIFLGCVFGFVREAIDPTIRTTDQVKRALGLDTIALPAIKFKSQRAACQLSQTQALPVFRSVDDRDGMHRYAADYPFSDFAEGVRFIQSVVDKRSKAQGDAGAVIGIISALPGEGKSTFASNFAHLLACAGERVILIDCDLRNPTLSIKLAGSAKVAGLVNLIPGGIETADVILTEATCGLAFLPAGDTSELSHTSNILASNSVETAINSLSATYKYTIVDLPPLTPLVDARSAANFVKFYIYIMEWGKSDLYHTTRLLDESREIRDCTVATVINKVDFRVMSTYEPSTIDSKYLERYCTSKSRREAILEKDQTLKTFVYDRLAEVWTPEQISGWLKGRTEPRLRAVGHETIYAFIYRAAQKAERLWRYLTRHHKR